MLVQLSNTIKLNNIPFQNGIEVGNTPIQNIKAENGNAVVSGSTDHNTLKNRDLPNQHPISAIIGLQEELDSLNQGVVFIPSVSSKGVISWTNNGDLDNPTSVNIKGVKGDTGERGERGLSGVYVGSGNMPEDCNIQIDPSGTTDDYATTQYVDDAIGDIETALDNIISIQNNLMGVSE